ncbi:MULTISPECIES: methyltransferase domain-containing protein [unclassified Variovorax]|uniref:methyltransferase domain-containing protein n=1 Tax=unclassified Variovorax TaxID=663243 RepID=UPI003ED17480
MKNRDHWKPTKFDWKSGRLKGARDPVELGVGSRLVADLVAVQYQSHLKTNARGRLLDLGCGKVPLYSAYAPYVSEIVCVDWAPGEHVDLQCDLSQPLPFDSNRFDTIILSDVLEHIPEPELLWSEMTRVLAPAGKIIMNVPFYYLVHEHPHDYYRYTNFALERFVKMNEMTLVRMSAIGGIVEIIADLFAKIVTKLPLIGRALAMLIQTLAWHFHKTRLGARVAAISSRHFPLGYFVIAARKP